ncbi:MAG: hypothetical protein EXQ94_03120 [Alphaproteobacteria bacterium]|nr:hypothetical protein [Alphaproteobacteria bacterium]
MTQLVDLWNAGRAARVIAGLMGTSRDAVESKLAKLRRAGRPLARRRAARGTPKVETLRRCLHCNQDFASQHICNRLCPTCLEEGPFTSAMV